MQVRLTPTELLHIAGISAEALKSMRRRDQIAIGFSGDDIVACACTPRTTPSR
jgi:hypothetical protein